MSDSCLSPSLTREYHLRLPNDFHHPTDLLQRVYDQQVVLEHIFIRKITVYGTIRVTNRALEKKVFLRYTIDHWRTSAVINARYLTHYSDNNTDVFQFKVYLPPENLSASMSFSFVICYRVNGEEFWDNNYSRNYTLNIIESTNTTTTSILNQRSILHNEILHQQIARDYHAIPNGFEQAGILCGLKNLGGTCYMNSVLQSLSFTLLLTDYFLSSDYSKAKGTRHGIVVNEYRNLLSLLCSGKYTVLTPIPMKQIISDVEPAYFGNQQQDAHEFLIFLLDHLHQELVKSSANQITDHSIITDLFYGTYRSITTCLTCHRVSYNLEPFVCLSLSIPFSNQCTLEDCLACLNEEEYLADDSKWFCPSCQRLSNVRKRLEIYRLPKVLVIQLKRFQLDFEMNWIKNDTLVLYPENNLRLSSSSSSASQPSPYTLYSVINHNGSLNDGHYTIFSRDSSSNLQSWFEYDDDTITYLPNDRLNLNSKAYLLFYTSKATDMSF